MPFSRSWRIYQLLFPGTGSESGRPNDIAQTVVPTWDLFRLQLGESYIRALRISNTNGGGVVDISQSFTGPVLGRIHVPIGLTGYNDSAASLRVDVTLGVTAGVPLDPWGRFDVGAADVTVGGCVVTNGVGAGGIRSLPLPLLIPTGNNLTVNWKQVAAGKTVIVDYQFFDIPGEIFQHVPSVNQGGST